MKESFQTGDLVLLNNGKWNGYAGVVSWPITADKPGYVLVCSEGLIAGLSVTIDEIELPNESTKGFTQLAYNLLKLSSHIIEKSVLQTYKIN